MTAIQTRDFCCFIMASYFGEIVEPTSRAIFDEFSDDEEVSPDPVLELSWSDGDIKLPPILEVSITPYYDYDYVNFEYLPPKKLERLRAFAEAHLLDEHSVPVAEVNLTENKLNMETESEDHHKNIPSRLYISNNKAVCLVSPTCPSELAYDFTETILPLLRLAKKVIVFTNESLHNFKVPSLSGLPPAFIRELKTSYNLSKNVAQKLQTPNFIIGIAAGIISWCQIFKKDGSAFVCYSDQEKLDSITATPYKTVIRSLGYDIIRNENPDYNKKSFYGKPEVIGGSSNIYM